MELRTALVAGVLVVAVAPFSRGLAAPGPGVHTPPASAPRIRVRLMEAGPESVIRGFDLRISSGRSLVSDRLSEWSVRCDAKKVTFRKISGFGAGPRVAVFRSAVEVSTPAGFFQMRGLPYRDSLVIHPARAQGRDGCEIVNHVDLEKYLDGLVNSEFSSKWSAEAISAQAIAARTYALYRMGEMRRDPRSRFDVDATTRDQVYEGFGKEDVRAAQTVARTRGWVLTIDGRNPLKAFYHSTCGGRTELPERVWGKRMPGFRKTVECPFCSVSPAHDWSLVIPQAELAAAIRDGVARDGARLDWPAHAREWVKRARLVGLRVDPSGAPVQKSVGRVPAGILSQVSAFQRSRRIRVQYEVAPRGHGPGTLHELVISAPQFREWVGPARLKSTAFQVVPNAPRGHLQLAGVGNGHGVGMCQWGAKVMGEKGYDYAAILKHYYPDARLARLW